MLKIWIALSLAFLGHSLYAQPPERGEECAATLSRADDALSRDRLSGLGRRGFLGTYPANTPASLARATRLGIMFWNVKIFVVGSLAEAVRVDAIVSRAPEILRSPAGLKEPDWDALSGAALLDAAERRIQATQAAGIETPANPMMHGFYVVVPGVDLKSMGADERLALARAIPRSRVYEISDAGLPTPLEPERVYDWFRPEAMSVQRYFEFEPTHFRMDGWTFPKQRGVLIFDEVTDAKSKTWKNMGVEARRLAKRQPIEVRVNTAFETALARVREQDRLGQTRENNRMNDSIKEMYLKMLASGDAFSFETWRQEGGPGSEWTLGGGTFGSFREGRLSLNSVYYEKTLDNAKLAFLMLRERLAAASVKFIDLGMLTPFSRRSLKGRYVPAEEFIALFEALDPGARPDFVTPWRP